MIRDKNVGYVYLVGAGCGQADLITVRGQRALQTCQTVVYDDLIDQSLLQSVPEDAKRCYMGKRQGRHFAAQEDICALLIAEARQGKKVVRLKGGDPFVFGRGGEEMQALSEAGISCEVIPGVTSAIAIPAEAGIPVTFRNISRSVHIIAGHTSSGKPDREEFALYAKLHGTLVFLMGLQSLPEITASLLYFGKSPETPAAVISGGNALFAQTIRGTLESIVDRSLEAQITAPAVIVIGEVAAMKLNIEPGVT